MKSAAKEVGSVLDRFGRAMHNTNGTPVSPSLGLHSAFVRPESLPKINCQNSIFGLKLIQNREGGVCKLWGRLWQPFSVLHKTRCKNIVVGRLGA